MPARPQGRPTPRRLAVPDPPSSCPGRHAAPHRRCARQPARHAIAHPASPDEPPRACRRPCRQTSASPYSPPGQARASRLPPWRTGRQFMPHRSLLTSLFAPIPFLTTRNLTDRTNPTSLPGRRPLLAAPHDVPLQPLPPPAPTTPPTPGRPDEPSRPWAAPGRADEPAHFYTTRPVSRSGQTG